MEENKNLIQSKKMQGQVPSTKEYSTTEILEMADIYFKSGLAPSHFKSKEALFIAFKWAIALGIDPFLGIRDIFVIDNIPSVRTEAAIAMVEASGFCENIEQYFEGNPFDDTYTAVCKVKRKGRKEHISKFSVSDAKNARLWGKKTNSGKNTSWVEYPHRMLMYRAVGFAIRDIFPDVLRGATLKEEVSDFREFEEVKEIKNEKGEITIEVTKKPENKTSVDKRRNVMKDLPPEDDETNFEEVK